MAEFQVLSLTHYGCVHVKDPPAAISSHTVLQLTTGDLNSEHSAGAGNLA